MMTTIIVIEDVDFTGKCFAKQDAKIIAATKEKKMISKIRAVKTVYMS